MTIEEIKIRREKAKPDVIGKRCQWKHAPTDIDWLIAEVERLYTDTSKHATALALAVNAHCTCGGGKPDDGCTACKVYHAITTQLEEDK